VPPQDAKDQRPNIRRALFVARDVVQYTTKVPAGRVIKWSELRKVLRAGTDSSHGETVKRVMEVLDKFGEDTVRIVDRPNQQMKVCFDDEAVERLSHLAASADAGTGTDRSSPTHAVVSGGKG